jgi:hypothetical protein
MQIITILPQAYCNFKNFLNNFSEKNGSDGGFLSGECPFAFQLVVPWWSCPWLIVPHLRHGMSIPAHREEIAFHG